MGTEIGRLGGYGFQGTVTAGDGSNQNGGKMGAGYVNLQKQRKKQQRKVGREEEGSRSNRPELVAFVLALCGTPVRHFSRSNQRAPKENNSRSSDVSGQGESAWRRTCK